MGSSIPCLFSHLQAGYPTERLEGEFSFPLMCMCVYVCAYTTCIWAPSRSGGEFSGAEVTGSCELPNGFWEQNVSPLSVRAAHSLLLSHLSGPRSPFLCSFRLKTGSHVAESCLQAFYVVNNDFELLILLFLPF